MKKQLEKINKRCKKWTLTWSEYSHVYKFESNEVMLFDTCPDKLIQKAIELYEL